MKTTVIRLLFLLLAFGLGGSAYADGSPCRIEAGTAAVEGGTLHYRKAGSGAPILLLHGLFAQKEQWDALLCRLAEAGHSAIAPDLPGYGQSQGFPLPDYQLERQAELLHQFMKGQNITRFDLAGSSMGGAIAALYTRRHPKEIKSLAFIGAPLGVTSWSSQVREAIYQGVNPFIPVEVAQFDLEIRLLFATPPAIPEAVKEGLVKEYLAQNRHYQQVWNIVGLYHSALLIQPRLRTPTLILWGAEEKIFAPEGAVQARRQFPRSKLIRLPQAGHLPMVEAPQETARLYLDFLRSGSGKPLVSSP